QHALLSDTPVSTTHQTSQVLRSLQSCPPLRKRNPKPTSVRDLRIDEINVIAALGDSITAAFAAKGLENPGEVLELKNTDENRGISFAIGGDEGAVTLGNFIKHFNPSLKGQSLGDHLVELCYGPFCLPYIHHKNDVLNGAQSGSLVINLERQFGYVLDMMERLNVDMENDFKLMMQFNVSQVWDLTHKSPWCSGLRASGLVYECTCAFLPGPAGEAMRKSMDTLTTEYNERLIQIQSDFVNENDPNFAVILDPLFQGVQVRDWPLSALSNCDCFHPHEKSHQVMAVGVWNNLFRPSSKKARTIDPNDKVEVFCPTESSRIQVI
ncbi:hypothetical protein HDU76_009010, partial [Blyttiomyces sp. JEL0837]